MAGNISRDRLAVGAVIFLGLLALLQYWLASRRPVSPWLQSAQEFVVTTSSDRGAGSLREAIFAADSASQRARIILRANRIVLQSPLPPLVNPLGVIVETVGQNPEIDAANIGSGAVFDVDAPNSVVSGIKISNAPEQAIVVRADGFRLFNMEMTNCDVGLYVAAGVTDLVAQDSRLSGNRLGIWLAMDNEAIILRNNRFNTHKDAAVWAVRGGQFEIPQASTIELRGNHFEDDRMSVVLGNAPMLIEDNEFVRARESAIYLIGQGAVVRGNRIRNGAGVGVFAHTTQGAVIRGNEFNHNRAIAVLVRSARNNLVQNNNLYENGYGIALVLGETSGPNIASENALMRQQFDGIIMIGDSSIVRRNRLMNNDLAGLRILDFIPLIGSRVSSDPLLDQNTSTGNKFNEPMHGEYRVRRSETAR